jgi:chorismate mutase/prephenate dehydratase
MDTKKLFEYRKLIDQLDSEILERLSKRADYAVQIGEIKRETGLELLDPARERQIINQLTDSNPGPLPAEAIQNIFVEILSACRQLQADLTVCFLGPKATFTHVAALKYFGQSAQYQPRESISDVFREVETGRADYGVVPVENSNEGAVNVTLDRFMESNLKACGEICLPVSQSLLSKAETLDQIDVVYSHPQALAQCREWLARGRPGASLVATASTAVAAGRSATEMNAAAVGSELLADLYGLRVLARDIQDRPVNLTRFLVLGRKEAPPTGRDKTSVWFVAEHKPGALYGSLKHFADLGVNMTRIESRPNGERPWEYVFFLDFEGHREDENVKELLKRLEESSSRLKIMGSYPMAFVPSVLAE